MMSKTPTFSNITYFRLWALTRTYVIPTFLLVAALSVLLHGLFEVQVQESEQSHLQVEQKLEQANPSNSHNPDTTTRSLEHDRLVNGKGVSLSVALIAIILMLTHCAYLLIMGKYIIYQHPADVKPGSALIIIIIISLAYSLQAVSVVLEDQARDTVSRAVVSLPVLSFYLFGVAYLILWLHGNKELKHLHHGFPRTIQTMKYFRGVDGIFSIAFFSYATLLLLSGGEATNRSFGSLLYISAQSLFTSTDFYWLKVIAIKDVLIFLCIIMYLYSSKIVSSAIKYFDHDTYLRYLKHVELDYQNSAELTKLGPIIGGEKVWFDYGCGSGRRLVEMIRLLFADGSTVKYPSKIYFYDSDQNCYDSLDESALNWLTQQNIPYEIVTNGYNEPERRSLLKTADVVLLSHIFYDPKIVSSIMTDLDALKNEAFVIIRLTGSTGMFRAISMTFANKLYRPSTRHAVPQIGLRELTEKHSFKEIGRYTVKQNYKISDVGATADLAKWCDVAYGESISFQVKKYTDDIVNTNIKVFPNDDQVYALQKSGS